MDIVTSEFLAAIPNPSVAAVFSTTATLPTAINPAEFLNEVITGYHEAQKDFNQNLTAPPYVSVVANPVYQPVIMDGNGGYYQDKSWNVTIRQSLAINDTVAREGIVQI